MTQGRARLHRLDVVTQAARTLVVPVGADGDAEAHRPWQKLQGAEAASRWPGGGVAAWAGESALRLSAGRLMVQGAVGGRRVKAQVEGGAA